MGDSLKSRIDEDGIDKDRCKGCELCVYACPHDVLEMSSDLNKYNNSYVVVKNKDDCTGCGFCYQMCPDNVLEIRNVPK